jgi:hypothetical protein
MNQKITATGNIIAFCGLLEEIKECEYSSYGFIKKFAITKSFFWRCKKERKNSNSMIQPKIEISINNIKINGDIDFCYSKINIELDERSTKEVGELFLNGKTNITFDIETITNPNLTISYKYSNLRKPQK